MVRVLSKSRRKATVLVDAKVVPASIATKVDDVVVGDRVVCGPGERDSIQINEVDERMNCLFRTYGSKTKEIAANLDHLFLVAAVKPLFNTVFVDRVLAVTFLQDIPTTLVINKIDQGLEETAATIDGYRNIGVEIIQTSAKYDEGLEPIRTIIDSEDNYTTAFTGVSGVGKSTLLNTLIPGADIRTGEVSRKTGKGRQTTSQAQAHPYRTDDGGVQGIIIDLPGIQHFGITHLTEQEAAAGFADFVAVSSDCEFADCLHRAEPKCAVKVAIQAGEIAESRYLSYLNMLEEIERAKPY